MLPAECQDLEFPESMDLTPSEEQVLRAILVQEQDKAFLPIEVSAHGPNLVAFLQVVDAAADNAARRLEFIYCIAAYGK